MVLLNGISQNARRDMSNVEWRDKGLLEGDWESLAVHSRLLDCVQLLHDVRHEEVRSQESEWKPRIDDNLLDLPVLSENTICEQNLAKIHELVLNQWVHEP